MTLTLYITKAKATEMGCTHHASYYGLPIYWGERDALVVPKSPILDPVFSLFAMIESTILMLTGSDRGFMFTIKGRL